MKEEKELRNLIIDIGKRLYQRGYVAGRDGNISVLSGDEIIATPSDVSKGYMTPDMLVKVDLLGNKKEGYLEASSELKMHLEVYRRRKDVKAVVHAHPPYSTSFAVAGLSLEKPILSEVILTLGKVPLTEYATPSTIEVPEVVGRYIINCNALLLANHGALTVGEDLYHAYYRMETLELFAQISLLTKILGRENVLDKEKIAKLEEIKVKTRSPSCLECGACFVRRESN